MPRKGNVTFVPESKPQTGAATLTLDQIPQEVRDEVEEMYANLKTVAGRFHVEYDTKEEVAAYMRQVIAYCALRPAGAIRFRKSPTRNLPDNQMDFRIVDLKTETEAANDDATNAVRTATDAVKTAATTPTPTTASKRTTGRKAA